MNTHKVFYLPDSGKGDSFVILIYFNHEGEEFANPVIKYHWPSLQDADFVKQEEKAIPVLSCKLDEVKQLDVQGYIDITYMQGSFPPKLKKWLDKKLDEHYDKFNDRYNSIR